MPPAHHHDIVSLLEFIVHEEFKKVIRYLPVPCSKHPEASPSTPGHPWTADVVVLVLPSPMERSEHGPVSTPTFRCPAQSLLRTLDCA